MKYSTMHSLRVGQRFTWIPPRWYGPCTLIVKDRRQAVQWDQEACRMRFTYEYDIKFDAAVVNPPGIEYGVPGHTIVRLLRKKTGGQRWKKRSSKKQKRR